MSKGFNKEQFMGIIHFTLTTERKQIWVLLHHKNANNVIWGSHLENHFGSLVNSEIFCSGHADLPQIGPLIGICSPLTSAFVWVSVRLKCKFLGQKGLRQKWCPAMPHQGAETSLPTRTEAALQVIKHALKLRLSLQ